MGLERVAGPGHRATRALWAKVFGPYLASRGETKRGLRQALLATWYNRVGGKPVQRWGGQSRRGFHG